MISLDSETTGVDLRHGSRPFFVTICNDKGEQEWWEWDVNPLTRQPIIPKQELEEVRNVIHHESSFLVLQNPRFDARALETVGIHSWPWNRTRDTLLAGHLLASSQPHDLTTMALVYLGINIKPYEEKLKVACNEARRLARSKFPEWRIAKKGLPEMPSAKGDENKEARGGESTSPWKFDMWLPRALAQELDYPNDHPWWTVTADYSNADSAVTLPLYKAMLEELAQRNLIAIYEERLRLLPVAHTMEGVGITLSKDRLIELRTKYEEESAESDHVCVNIAADMDYDLVLPKSGNNKSLLTFAFDVLKLPVSKDYLTDTGNPSLNKAAMDHYKATLPAKSKALTFINHLGGIRSRGTALSYMENYERHWLETEHGYLLYSSINPTGTGTLRLSSSNPNQQNISKKEDFNLRYIFGPDPGRVWWSFDYSNLELVIPAYEANEVEMIQLFERPDDPPYYGSYHMMIFDTLHPEKFAKHGMECKEVYASTWYQWTKNGDFAVTYGSVEQSGTADKAYHLPGAFNRVKSRLKAIHGPGGLNEQQIAYANKFGYVETMPDKTVDPNRGYPLQCARTKWGKVSPTVPLNYHVQGTAMWVALKAMVRCGEYLQDIPNHFLIMQIHDELVFDFPAGSGPNPWKANLPHVNKIMELMVQSGDDIGIPLRVAATYHPNNWSEGIKLTKLLAKK